MDTELINQQIAELFKFKILLLGAGESGKSTIVKQLKLIHKKKLEPEELRLTADSLHQNVIDCMKALLNAVKTFDFELTEAEQQVEEMICNRADGSHSLRLSLEECADILTLWQGEAVQKAYAKRNEFWLLDSFEYYIDNLERFCESDYVPTDDDAIMARIRTTGIVVTDLEQRVVAENEHEPDKLLFQVVDVGGQRNERKKWIHCFDDVRAILFCVNLAGYNQVLFEDSSKNRMIESLELFKKVTNNKQFADTPLFLFLNKKDLFEKSAQTVNLNTLFEDYSGGLEMMPALAYIEQQFKDRCPPGKEVHIETVAACLRQEIRAAFKTVKSCLYDNNKEDLVRQVKELKKKQSSISGSQQKDGICACCMG